MELSLKILSMPNLELEEYLETIILNNPFAAKRNFYENTDKTNFLEIIDKNSDQILPHIYSQISLIFSGKNLKLANYLCQFLDQYGYFRGDKQQIANSLNIKQNQLIEILTKLKDLTPFGIFSENLGEFLIKQLKEQEIFDNIYLKIIENLELVAKANFSELAKISNIKLEEVINRIKIIKRLDPRPTSINPEEQAIPIIADLKITILNEEIITELNDNYISQIYFNKEYYQLMRKQTTSSAEKLYLRNSSQDLFNLLRSVRNRAQSLLSITQKIVEHQKDFFLKGPKYLKPLTINLLAEELNYHPSTVSRAIKDKYLDTPKGYFKLKYFFNTAFENNKQSDDVRESSSKYIQLKIKELISREDETKPLADEFIKDMLNQSGYEISRRTIVKYRKILGIANSSERKKRKILEKM